MLEALLMRLLLLRLKKIYAAKYEDCADADLCSYFSLLVLHKTR